MLKSEKENESKFIVPASASLDSNTAMSHLADKVNNGSDHREETNTRKTKRGRLEQRVALSHLDSGENCLRFVKVDEILPSWGIVDVIQNFKFCL